MAGQPFWVEAGAIDPSGVGGVCAKANAGVTGGRVAEWAADTTGIECARCRTKRNLTPGLGGGKSGRGSGCGEASVTGVHGSRIVNGVESERLFYLWAKLTIPN